MEKSTTKESNKFKKTYRNIIKLLKLQYQASKRTFFVIILTALLSGVSPLIFALCIKKIIDNIILYANNPTGLNASIANAMIWVAVLCVCALVTSALGAYRFKLTQTSAYYIADIMRKTMFKKMERISLAAFDDSDFRDKYNLAKQQIGNNVASVMDNILVVMQAFITTFSFLGTIIIYRLWIIIAVVILMIPAVIFSYKKQEKYFMTALAFTPEKRKSDYYSGLLLDQNNQNEMRVFRSNVFFYKKYADSFKSYIGTVDRALNYDLKKSLISASLDQITTVAIYAFAIVYTLLGRYTIAEFTIITAACENVRSSLGSAIEVISNMYGNILFFDLYEDFIHKAPDFPDGVYPLPEESQKEILFKNVDFRYPNSKVNALNHVSLKFEQGKTYAIVGPNGAGKSTLVKLILRMYEPTSGEIALNGTAVNEISFNEYCSMFSTVFQDYARYSLSFAESVALTSEYDTEKVQKVYADAGFPDLSSLPTNNVTKQFDKSGYEPSVGQWQKIAIARSYYKDGNIVILDEPTSALDPMSEQALYQGIKEHEKGKTIIYISHRMISTIFADEIIFIKDGEIVEFGSHAELMKKNGEYFKMYRIQEDLFVNNCEKD